MIWLPDGCARPDPAELEAFWQHCRATLSDRELPDNWQVRWIGLDEPTTDEVIELILAGDKTGTFTLPWLITATGQPAPAVGDAIILVDFAGTPKLLVRLTDIYTVNFGDITAADTAIDGSPVRDLSIWIPLHTNYWNALLAPYDLATSAEMPVLVEPFELLFPDPR
ncbi:MAG: ASCH domain-containing protein [Gammaproteobacteria bacterium]|nr:ASCH domain-containing protein [Gammaproteobacteria bacterium]NND54233.1 ASCH domain-containing protein [Gammaproteobacteria bacterium]